TEKRVGLLGARACRWHQCCSIALNGDFGTSRFKGNYILRHLTRLRNRWLRPKVRLAYCPEAATAAPGNVRSWPIASFSCVAEFGRHRCTADFSRPSAR